MTEPTDTPEAGAEAPPRAVVVDELPLVRAGIAAGLGDAGYDVVAETLSGREAVGLVRTEDAAVVVAGIPADLDVVDLVRRLVRRRPAPAVVALVPPASGPTVAALVALGAGGVGLRTGGVAELVGLVDAAVAGGHEVAPALRAGLSGAFGPVPVPNGHHGPLSGREREVLVLLAEGMTNKEIAASLLVTLATVKTHLVHIYSKLGAGTRHEALARAVALGLLGRP